MSDQKQREFWIRKDLVKGREYDIRPSMEHSDLFIHTKEVLPSEPSVKADFFSKEGVELLAKGIFPDEMDECMIALAKSHEKWRGIAKRLYLALKDEALYIETEYEVKLFPASEEAIA